MLDWFECLNGSGCYSAKAGAYMAHIQPYPEKAWLWNWNKHTGVAFTLEDAKREIEDAIKQAG